ncbi:MAG: hypothetical protein LQ347_004450 [Umbilicaria vellea]|nr:MAG: hypothetical protein LQ347_004450 [Umbilicaria vellea]
MIDTLALSAAESGLLRYEYKQRSNVGHSSVYYCIEEEGLSVTGDGERLPARLRESLLSSATMITKFITDVSTKFNPFSKRGKTCRIFLAHLPASARRTMKINIIILPRTSREGSTLRLKFKDGKEMQLDTQKLSINDVMEEVDRHTRMLNRQADLMGN